ncbi:MAG: T9SS type A sorting domain-containing protein [Bacteroidota bacterium]
MTRLSLFALALFLAMTPAAVAQMSAEALEAEGLTPEINTTAPAVAVKQGGLQVCVDDVLLVPDSNADNLVILDPTTGDVVNTAFLTDSDPVLSTPVNALGTFDGDGILISDQVEDVVQEFDCNGDYVGVFAPAGGRDVDILDNIRGMAYSPDGTELWVTVAAGANANSIARFDSDGTYLGNLTNATGSPFDVFPREFDVLISDIDNEDVARVDFMGTLLVPFVDSDGVSSIDFPEQIAAGERGEILVAGFDPPSGVYRFDAHGGFIERLAADNTRGVYPLPNGDLLYTNRSGTTQIASDGAVVRSVYATGDRFIELFEGRGDETSDVRIEAETSTPIVQQGGILLLDITLINDGDTVVNADVYFEASGPASIRKRLQSGPLTPGTRGTRTVRIRVPRTAPTGLYTLNVALGDFRADTEIDAEDVMVEVEPMVCRGCAAPLAASVPVDATLLTEDEVTEARLSVGPNPVVGTATFRFALDAESDVRLAVYDALGREVAEVANGRFSPGTHQAAFDARSLQGGVYIYRLETGADLLTGELIVVR